MVSKKKILDKTYTLFEERVGICYISLGLDTRHPKGEKDEAFPLCARFTILRSRYYYNLGEKCSSSQLAKVAKATGQGERRVGIETNYERQTRLLEVFNNFVATVVNLNETGPLTIDRIKTALTGRSESSSFIGVWEEIIAEKRKAGKAGTADCYEGVLKSFREITGFGHQDGFAIDTPLINRWVEGMKARNFASATQGIHLRSCRVVVNRCIGEGYLLPKAYMFGKRRDKVKIPVGASRKRWYLSVPQMQELYAHWKNRDVDFPIHNTRSRENPKNTVKSEGAKDLIYQGLAMFLMQYLCCGCNLIDLALLRYNRFFFESNRDAFQFIRKKSEDETRDGDGMEVIVPIIEPMREILDAYGSEPVIDQLVFPFLMGDAIEHGEQAVRDRVHQENRNIADRMKKMADQIGWTVHPTGTYARHSFATNLHAAKVPMEYVSDAMGHSLGNRGQITMRYISPYTIEERRKYNNLLLGIAEDETTKTVPMATSSTKQALLEKMDAFSEDDIKEALMMLKKKEMDRFEAELYG